jgi:Golgi nucleoside diphosphatase
LDVFAIYKDDKKLLHHLRKYLGALIEFAKTVLQEKEDQWSTYPIYLKATGGLRTLPRHERVRIMTAVRELFNDHETFNPFSFEDERARVISGEEEAIYGWVGVNFALGTLIQDSTLSPDEDFSKVRTRMVVCCIRFVFCASLFLNCELVDCISFLVNIWDG